ncbi:hypothetical protein H2200_001090 [Cladophialophora chaetospira]|uniref:DNA2/NAM7 helicase-like C-terminal domain-containing protein n=1 Tax=Cladophialophora chaetospira TaxID=386627 RepID=A0AA38XKC5_9EURO|nr:hypothetical protein H2200_001090 [Cladophialophora chaetospira]
MKKKHPAKVLIIDEAAAAKHFEILIPLIKLLPWLLRLVLAGDPDQFSAFALSREGQKWWFVSLFEKMKGESWPRMLLRRCYRQHHMLMQPTSQLFYHNELEAEYEEPSEETKALLRSFRRGRGVGFLNQAQQKVKLSGTCHFIDVENSVCENDSTMSSKNHPQNQCAEAVAKCLISEGVDPSKIMMITGYRANLSDLRTMARDGRWSEDELEQGVDLTTIIASQGLEKQIVIMTVTRNMRHDQALAYSFLTRRRLLNVAISRPSQMLIITGHWRSIMAIPSDAILFQTMTFMKSHWDKQPEFLLYAGAAPYRQLLEAEVGRVPVMANANTQTHVG